MRENLQHQLFVDAHRALKRGNLQQALELSASWAKKYPKDVNAHLMLATISNRLGNFEDGLEHANTAIYLAADNRLAWIYRASAKQGLGELEEALKDANHLVELHPNDSDAHNTRNSIAHELYAKAEDVEDWDQLIAKDPNFGAAYVWRAYRKIESYQYKAAIDDCNKALSLNWYRAFALTGRAWANLGMNNITAADGDFRTLYKEFCDCQTAAEWPNILCLQAALLMVNNYFEDALVACNKALSLRPEWINASITRAHFLCCLKRLKKAMSQLEELSQRELKPRERAFVLSNQARIHLRQEHFDQASQIIAEAVSTKPGIPSILATQGLILTRSGKLDEALLPLNEAISIDPYFAEAYWFRHELYERLGMEVDSARDRKIAVDFNYKPYI